MNPWEQDWAEPKPWEKPWDTPAESPSVESLVTAPLKGAVHGAVTGITGLMKTAGIAATSIPRFPDIIKTPDGKIDWNAGFQVPTSADKARLLGGDPMYQRAGELEGYVNKNLPLSQEEQGRFSTQLGESVGSFGLAALSGKYAPAVFGAQSLGATFGAFYDKGIADGKKPEDAYDEAISKGLKSGAVSATIFALVPHQLQVLGDKALASKWVTNFANNKLKSFLADRTAQVAEGSVLGATSQVGQNVAVGQPTLEGIGPAAGAMGVIQSLIPRANAAPRSGSNGKPSTPITDSLGANKGGMPIPDAMKNVEAIANRPTESDILSGATIPATAPDLAGITNQINRVDAPVNPAKDTILSALLQREGGPKQNSLELQKPPVQRAIDTKLADILDQGGDPAMLLSQKSQTEQQRTELFNKRRARIIENFAAEGVELDPTTAAKLTLLADNPAEFNKIRQKLIESVKGKTQEVPARGPMKDLKDLIPGEFPPPTATPPSRDVQTREGELGTETGQVGELAKQVEAAKADIARRRALGEIPAEPDRPFDPIVNNTVPVPAKAPPEPVVAPKAETPAPTQEKPVKASETPANEPLKFDHYLPNGGGPADKLGRPLIITKEGISLKGINQAGEAGSILVPGGEQKFYKVFSDTFDRTQERTEYGQRQEHPTERSRAYVWSNSEEKWIVGRDFPANKDIPHLTDSNVIVAPWANIKESQLIADHLPPPPVHAFSSEAMQKNANLLGESKLSGEDKTRAWLQHMASAEPIKSDKKAYFNRLMDQVNAEWKSKMGSETGSVANPFNGEMLPVSKAALEMSNEPLLKRMAKLAMDDPQRKSILKSYWDDMNKSWDQREQPANPATHSDAAEAAPIDDFKAWEPFLSSNSLGRGLKNIIPAMDQIRPIAPKIYGALREMQLDEFKRTSALYKDAVEPVFKLRKAVGRKEFERIGNLFSSGQEEAALSQIERLRNGQELADGLRNGWMAKREGLHAALVEAFPEKDFGHLENYWPREVVDAKKLRKLLDRKDKSAVRLALEKAVARKKEALQDPSARLTPEEENAALVNIIEGSRRFPGSPGYLKERTIKEIDSKMTKLYQPLDVSMNNYVSRISRDLSARKFLGRIDENSTSPWLHDSKGSESAPVGSMMAELLKSGELNDDGARVVTENINAILKKHPASGQILRTIGTIQILGNLGQFQNLMSQLADVAINSSVTGMGPAVRGMGRALESNLFNTKRSKSYAKLEDVYVHEGNPEVMEYTRKGGWQNSLSDFILTPFFKFGDRVGKESLLNSEKIWAEKQSNMENPDFRFKIMERSAEKIWGSEEWGRMKSQMRDADWVQPELRKWLYDQLASVQPVHKSDMALGYLKSSPIQKIPWRLMSFTLKQMGLAKSRIYDEARAGNHADAARWGARYVFYMAVGNMGLQIARDIIDGKDTISSGGDYIFGAILTSMGLNRVQAVQASKGSFAEMAGDRMFPGLFGTVKDAAHDAKLGIQMANGTNGGDFMVQSELLKRAPWAGRSLYMRYGAGHTKELKQEAQRSNPTDLETISNAILGNSSQRPKR